MRSSPGLAWQLRDVRWRAGDVRLDGVDGISEAVYLRAQLLKVVAHRAINHSLQVPLARERNRQLELAADAFSAAVAGRLRRLWPRGAATAGRCMLLRHVLRPVVMWPIYTGKVKQSLANNASRTPESVRIRPTFEVLLLLSVEAAEGHGRRVSRAPWVMRVIVEQLAAGLDGSFAHAVAGATDPNRGVTDRTVQPVVLRLVENGHLVPLGTGEHATWTVSADVRRALSAVKESMRRQDVRVIDRAVQRAAAIEVALSKTRAASAESSAATVATGSTRRQVVR